jgi:hypothetical protein
MGKNRNRDSAKLITMSLKSALERSQIRSCKGKTEQARKLLENMSEEHLSNDSRFRINGEMRKDNEKANPDSHPGDICRIRSSLTR